MSDRAIRWLFALAVALLGAYALRSLELSTDITNFMPRDSDAELAVLASRLADSSLTRTMILTIGAPSADAAVAAASRLAGELREHPEVESLRSGVDAGQLEDVYRVYFPRRFGFVSDEPEREIPRLTAPEALARRARELRAALALPTSTLSKRTAAADPLGAFERIVQRLRGERPALEMHDGGFVTRDGRWAVLFLTTRGSAFDSAPQARLLADLDAAFARVQAAAGETPLVLETAGANRFAVAAEASMRRDVHWIAALSFLGVAAVFLLFLRSLHYFALALLPPVAGMLCGAVATHLVFGHLDGITIAFGATLIGVAIDYSIHVIDHYRLEPAARSRDVVRRLRPALALGGLTTMASFVGLCITSFPGFREIGVFSTLGLAVALLVTLYVLPAFLDGSGDRTVPPVARRVAGALGGGFRALARRRRWVAGAALASALLVGASLPGLRFDDDLSQLMALDPKLRAEEERVRERVARSDSGRVILALGDDAESALVRNDQVALRLDAARRDGALGEFRSLHALLWSRELQQRNLRALAAEPGLAERVETAFAAEGFRTEALAPFRLALAAAPPPPLDAAELLASPLRDLVSPLLLDLEGRSAAVTYLAEVGSEAELARALDGLEHVHVFDAKGFLNSIYGEFRATTLRQAGVGCAMVIAVLGLYYRRWRPALAAFVPSLLVAGILLAVFSVLGVRVNLLHVTSLVMVMGMGVDYGIFMVESEQDPAHLDATLLSLLLACLITVFVFGTLAISEHGALRAIGATTGVGMLLTLVAAPVTLALLRGGADPSGPEPRP